MLLCGNFQAIIFDYELLNLGTKQVVESGQLYPLFRKDWRTLVFENLRPGNYQLTWKNVHEQIYYAELCPSKSMVKTPMPPLRTDHCDLFEKINHHHIEIPRRHIFASGPTNSTLKSKR
jgi:hypothetical protein